VEIGWPSALAASEDREAREAPEGIGPLSARVANDPPLLWAETGKARATVIAGRVACAMGAPAATADHAAQVVAVGSSSSLDLKARRARAANRRRTVPRRRDDSSEFALANNKGPALASGAFLIRPACLEASAQRASRKPDVTVEERRCRS